MLKRADGLVDRILVFMQPVLAWFPFPYYLTCDVDRDDAGGDGVRISICLLIWWWKVFLGPVRLFRLGRGGIGGWGLGSMASHDLTAFTFLCWGSLKEEEIQKQHCLLGRCWSSPLCLIHVLLSCTDYKLLLKELFTMIMWSMKQPPFYHLSKIKDKQKVKTTRMLDTCLFHGMKMQLSIGWSE